MADDFGGGVLYEFELSSSTRRHHSTTRCNPRSRSSLKADGLADHECDGLGFRFPDALRCACAALGPVKSLVGYFRVPTSLRSAGLPEAA